ncbi:ATP-binding protein [Vibrio cholerae]|nr:ATP-binding protein [Vibrio cholerae]QHQ90083.1 ATP-binding protein [Vibrio cholerae O1]EGQ9392044.1 ATP-binding protein [Vibrio cholerae]EGQ9577851.1 ATP-binding protein [Vibrio cholerae]EGQ9845913.1 ATP-binding protein [Vibrio cholerae]
MGISCMPIKSRALRHLSLKTRLLLAAALWLGAMILAAGYLIPNLIHQYLLEDVQNQLQLSMDEITANLEANPQGQLTLTTRLADPRFTQPYSGLYWSATLGDQTLRSRSLWDRFLTEETHVHGTIYLGAKEESLIVLKRTVYLPEFSQPITITIGLDDAPLKATLQRVSKELWMILALLFSGILVLTGVQVTWSLRPLSKMQRELSALRDGQQNALNGDYPQEISPLVNDLNALLFHYQELLERARHHAGNLSHALKTPLSVLKNEVAQLNDAQLRSQLQPSVEQIQQQIDYHLGRARMAGSANILSVKTAPSARVDAISQAFDKVYAERGITLVNELDSDLEVAVEPTDLDEMIGNLLENSYKWANSLIRVHSQILSDDWVQICVEDDGAGISATNREKALKRGVRLDETTPGTGLGLNIVSEMAHSYRGALALGESQLGGLKATLTLKQPTRAAKAVKSH